MYQLYKVINMSGTDIVFNGTEGNLTLPSTTEINILFNELFYQDNGKHIYKNLPNLYFFPEFGSAITKDAEFYKVLSDSCNLMVSPSISADKEWFEDALYKLPTAKARRLGHNNVVLSNLYDGVSPTIGVTQAAMKSAFDSFVRFKNFAQLEEENVFNETMTLNDGVNISGILTHGSNESGTPSEINTPYHFNTITEHVAPPTFNAPLYMQDLSLQSLVTVLIANNRLQLNSQELAFLTDIPSPPTTGTFLPTFVSSQGNYWTPGVTSSFQARWQKVGNRVTVNFFLDLSISRSIATGNVFTMGNLPFRAVTYGKIEAVGQAATELNFLDANTNTSTWTVMVDHNSNNFSLICSYEDGTSSNFSNGFGGSFTYYTDQ